MIDEKMLREAAAEANTVLVEKWAERDLPEHTFSPEFECNMRKMIQKTKCQPFYRILKRAVCLFLALFIGCASVLTVHVDAREALLGWIKRSLLEQDAQYLVKKVEDLHPSFVLNMVPMGYEAAKEQYLQAVESPTINEESFELETWRYLSSLNDAYTGIDCRYTFQKRLNIELVRLGENTWLKNENGELTEKKVISVAGIPTEDLWSVMEELLVMDNEFAYVRYSDYLCCDTILDLAGVNVEENELPIVLEEKGVQEEWSVSFISRAAWKAEHTSKEETISYKMLDDVFYIDMNSCTLDTKFSVVEEALAEWAENGISKVIIDVRGNTGGNSVACEKLLEAMNMSPPAYTVYSRTSGTELFRVEDPLTATHYRGSVPNPEIDLIVLCDEGTGGSATVLCVYVQDGELGRLVGYPSSTSPNNYLYNVACVLPNTELTASISCKYMERPDKEADPDMLEMDVLLPYGEDALAVALSLLNE